MKVVLSLDPAGQEYYLKHKCVYNWHFTAQPYEADENKPKPPKGNVEVACVTIKLPSADVCATNALAALKAREQEVRAEAQKELTEIQQRVNDLLMIGHTPATEIL